MRCPRPRLAAAGLSLFGVLALLTTAAAEPPAPESPKEGQVKEPALRKELLAMMEEDQRVRNAVIKEMGEKGLSSLDTKPVTDPAQLKILLDISKKMEAVDTKDRKRLQEIIDKHGWPGKALVGKEAAHAAWLIAQHADADLAFQKRCLKLMEAAPRNDVDRRDLAYRTDRILVAEKKKQRYGTQLLGQGGKFRPQPIEDEANVDRRRAEVGLPPLAEYLKWAQEFYEKAEGKPPKQDKGPGGSKQ
jgi:hypothetical protein